MTATLNTIVKRELERRASRRATIDEITKLAAKGRAIKVQPYTLERWARALKEEH